MYYYYGKEIVFCFFFTSKKSNSHKWDGSILNVLRKSSFIKDPGGAEN